MPLRRQHDRRIAHDERRSHETRQQLDQDGVVRVELDGMAAVARIPPIGTRPSSRLSDCRSGFCPHYWCILGHARCRGHKLGGVSTAISSARDLPRFMRMARKSNKTKPGVPLVSWEDTPPQLNVLDWRQRANQWSLVPIGSDEPAERAGAIHTAAGHAHRGGGAGGGECTNASSWRGRRLPQRGTRRRSTGPRRPFRRRRSRSHVSAADRPNAAAHGAG